LTTLFTAKTLLTPFERIEQPFVLVEAGRIADLGSRACRQAPAAKDTIDLGELTLAPGLIDMHIHGADGHDVMEEDATALASIETFLSDHGVTSYFPTTVTAPLDVTLAALERLADAIEAAQDQARAHPVGIHIEGPFISHARRGVHPLENLIAPSLSVFQRFWEASRGHIRVMTIAPELDGALEVIAEAAKRGVCVSMGHSDATLEMARAGVKAGARHATHTFNAMRPLAHRDPGILTEVLTNSQISADIIADGLHVDAAVVQMFLRLKGAERTVLITDSTAATGMPPGKYHMGDFEFQVADGRCLANGVLAGSTLTLDRAVRNAMNFGEWDLRDALCAATANPARTTGLDERGFLKIGVVADFIALTPSGEVRKTVVAGKEIG